MSEKTRFGLHMGNTTITLSTLKEGKSEIVASKFGDRSSYACIAATNENEFSIGLPAKQGIARNNTLTVVNNFQFLNVDLTAEQIDEAISKSCLCKVNHNETSIEYELCKNDEFSTKCSPFDVAVHLLKNNYENATYAAAIAESDLEVVVAVPMNWSQKSRQQFCKAVRDGGFDVIGVITEPSAALLAYDIGVDPNETSNVLIVRLGGLTSDLTIMSVKNGLYSVIDSLHLPHLGGNILTQALSEYLASEFFAKYKLDPRESRRTMVKLNETAENVKHILSSMPSAHVFVESLMDGIDWSQNISRARFENVIGAKLSLFSRPIDEFIKKHNVDIDKIIFTGGSMKIPKLQSTISALVPKAQVLSSIPPDEVISIGCSKQSAYLTGTDFDDVTEHVDIEVTTLPDDITFQYVDADNKPIDDTEPELLFKNGAPVPSINAVTITKQLKHPVKLAVRQGDHVDYIENDPSKDLKEIVARLHGGIRTHNDNTQTIEPVTVHLHLN